jgi:hypothetical protein
MRTEVLKVIRYTLGNRVAVETIHALPACGEPLPLDDKMFGVFLWSLSGSALEPYTGSFHMPVKRFPLICHHVRAF